MRPGLGQMGNGEEVEREQGPGLGMTMCFVVEDSRSATWKIVGWAKCSHFEQFISTNLTDCLVKY
jgi:hypothetical protein